MKNSKFKKILKFCWSPLFFIFQMVKLKLKINKYDKKLPLMGKLSNNGFYTLTISRNLVEEIKSKFYNKNKKNKIIFKYEHKKCIQEIFKIIHPIIKDYLGENSYLDGAYIKISKKEYLNRSLINSISQSWHTDNVGNRVKCLICLEGDGSQPTLLMPSNMKSITWTNWFKNLLIESIRWGGVKNFYDFKDKIYIKHKPGIITLFDTDLLHRGSYENSISDRIIFFLEFSNPEKHKFIDGPIGTFEKNLFFFDEQLMQLDIFSSLIDKQRLSKNKFNGLLNYKI